MRLTRLEFWAMNNPVRRCIQKRLEFRLFQGMGLTEPGKRILEIGCGSGYGARLLSSIKPASYVGIDLMPEQIERTKGIDLPNTAFAVMDATDLTAFEDESIDCVVVFGILHHIPAWRIVLSEIERVLAPGGKLFVEEPQKDSVKLLDRFFRWHVPEAGFSYAELETGMMEAGLEILQKRAFGFFNSYCAQKPGSGS
jgi:ubiquinone/menaquinone biosynthesis C-methylase UbiE